MADEVWPKNDCEYQFSGVVPGAEGRWQAAIAQALKTQGGLELKDHGNGFYDLVGDCPRCGHSMSQSLEWEIVMPRDTVMGVSVSEGSQKKSATDSASFEIVCSCKAEHTDREEKVRGCGWGRGLTVILQRPAQPANPPLPAAAARI
jgi:hypothetical protein